MVDAHEMKDRRVEVVHVDFVFDRVPAEFVRRAVDDAAPDAAAGQPHGEAEWMMFAPVRTFRGGRATEFTAPDHQGFIQQTTRFQVLQQPRNRLVHGGTVVRQFLAQFAVLVPELATAPFRGLRVINLHHAHATLGQPPRHQTLLAEDVRNFFADAVKFLRRRGFPFDVECLRRFHLHAEGEFERFDARAQSAVFSTRLRVQKIDLFQQVELIALLLCGKARVRQIRNRVLQIGNQCSLVRRRQETGTPQGRALGGLRRADDDEARQVLVFAAQTVEQP